MSRSRWLILTSVLLVLLSIYFRYLSFPYSNHDLTAFNLIWYNKLVTQGWRILGTNFTNYSPPYSYLLALVSLFKNFLSPITAIKLIPTCFDLLGTFIIYKLIRTKYTDGNIPFLAAAVYFTAPTVLINSSYWGQADSIYAVFILAAIYFLITDRSNLAWIFFGVSFAIKAQAVFIAPLFLMLLLQKRLKWTGILWVPVIFTVAILPTVLLGRQPLDVLSVYITQSETYNSLSLNAPNIWIFFSRYSYAMLIWITLGIGTVLILTWIFSTAKYAQHFVSNKQIAFYALISVVIVPFLLPKMHDRYFYLADVLSIVVAFLHPELWFLSILFQASSLLSYSVFLFSGPRTLVYIAAIINTFAIAYLLKQQRTKEGRTTYPTWATRVLPLSIKVILPILIVGTAFRAIFTPIFLRIDYQVLSVLGNDRQEWYQNDLQVNQFITSQKEPSPFRHGQENVPIRDKNISQQLIDIRAIVTTGFMIWNFLLLVLFVISLLFWFYDDLAQWLKSIKESGWIILFLSPAAGLLVAGLALLYGMQEPVVSVLSKAFWITAGVFVFGVTALLGFIVTKLPIRKLNQ